MALYNNLEKARMIEDGHSDLNRISNLTRCKKCAYAKKSGTEGHCFCSKFGTTLPDDFFCGYGVNEYIREKEKVREKSDDLEPVREKYRERER